MATPANVRRNMQNYRERLRAQGLRPKTIWLPDTRSPEFAERVRRESLALRGQAGEDEALDWIEDAMTDNEA